MVFDGVVSSGSGSGSGEDVGGDWCLVGADITKASRKARAPFVGVSVFFTLDLVGAFFLGVLGTLWGLSCLARSSETMLLAFVVAFSTVLVLEASVASSRFRFFEGPSCLMFLCFRSSLVSVVNLVAIATSFLLGTGKVCFEIFPYAPILPLKATLASRIFLLFKIEGMIALSYGTDRLSVQLSDYMNLKAGASVKGPRNTC